MKNFSFVPCNTHNPDCPCCFDTGWVAWIAQVCNCGKPDEGIVGFKQVRCQECDNPPMPFNFPTIYDDPTE